MIIALVQCPVVVSGVGSIISFGAAQLCDGICSLSPAGTESDHEIVLVSEREVRGVRLI